MVAAHSRVAKLLALVPLVSLARDVTQPVPSTIASHAAARESANSTMVKLPANVRMVSWALAANTSAQGEQPVMSAQERASVCLKEVRGARDSLLSASAKRDMVAAFARNPALSKPLVVNRCHASAKETAFRLLRVL
jgi:hypothetical protein